MVGVSVLPHEGQFIGGASLEKWDYCLRRLFVLKGQSLKAAIGYVRSLSSSMACEDYDVDVDLGPPLFFFLRGQVVGAGRSNPSQTSHRPESST